MSSMIHNPAGEETRRGCSSCGETEFHARLCTLNHGAQAYAPVLDSERGEERHEFRPWPKAAIGAPAECFDCNKPRDAAIHRPASDTPADEQRMSRLAAAVKKARGDSPEDVEASIHFLNSAAHFLKHGELPASGTQATEASAPSARRPSAAEVLGLLTVHLLQEHWDEAREIAYEIRIDFATNPARPIAIDFVTAHGAEVEKLREALRTLLDGLPIFPDTDDPATRISAHHLGLLTVGQIATARAALASARGEE